MAWLDNLTNRNGTKIALFSLDSIPLSVHFHKLTFEEMQTPGHDNFHTLFIRSDEHECIVYISLILLTVLLVLWVSSKVSMP